MAREKIRYKNKLELEYMRQNGRVLAELFEKIKTIIAPGISTLDLDRIAEEFILAKNGIPSFKGYEGFPASICASINQVIIHGIPSKNDILKEGDIIGVDVGMFRNNLHADTAYTFKIGKIDEKKEILCRVTQEALQLGIAAAHNGRTLFDISNAIQTHVEKHGFSVVREFVGHGVGNDLHEPPQIPNYRKNGLSKIKLRPGMTLAIEPMVNAGCQDIVVRDDQWTICTADGAPSAHYEHTIAVTENGPLILTAL
ncbi:MAG: type I methionyl aminopeptidase [Spirochaetae bacterium HGW-Spirochaetae-6]|nr:MAG: type I methionyl aminopeptidase [Spirochaetae bacterium HGW-Spirochaetae-6]